MAIETTIDLTQLGLDKPGSLRLRNSIISAPKLRTMPVWDILPENHKQINIGKIPQFENIFDTRKKLSEDALNNASSSFNFLRQINKCKEELEKKKKALETEIIEFQKKVYILKIKLTLKSL